MLWNKAECVLRTRGARSDSIDHKRPAIGIPESGDERHEGRFPGPVGPKKPEEFPWSDVEGHAIEGRKRAESLDDAFGRDKGGGANCFGLRTKDGKLLFRSFRLTPANDARASSGFGGRVISSFMIEYSVIQSSLFVNRYFVYFKNG